jgi:hypothetical protein
MIPLYIYITTEGAEQLLKGKKPEDLYTWNFSTSTTPFSKSSNYTLIGTTSGNIPPLEEILPKVLDDIEKKRKEALLEHQETIIELDRRKNDLMMIGHSA